MCLLPHLEYYHHPITAPTKTKLSSRPGISVFGYTESPDQPFNRLYIKVPGVLRSYRDLVDREARRLLRSTRPILSELRLRHVDVCLRKDSRLLDGSATTCIASLGVSIINRPMLHDPVMPNLSFQQRISHVARTRDALSREETGSTRPPKNDWRYLLTCFGQ